MRENYANNDIKSIRIVSVDSYMKYPVNGLDPCYSEFRGNEIKQVSYFILCSILIDFNDTEF